MDNYDWSKFITRISINAPIEKLYTAWATSEGIESWFLRLSEFKSTDGKIREGKELVQKGDKYKWRWYGWDDNTTEVDTILEANGRDFFKFGFGNGGDCIVTIKSEEGETMVELEQDNIPTDEVGKHSWHLGCKTGWTFYLANLKSVMEGGIDLRNRNEKIKRVVNS
ncbi:MAG: SRPBCC domain-containing protein [Ferruginibacter sp.]